MDKANIAILYPCSFPNISRGPAINHMQLMAQVAQHPLISKWSFLSSNKVPLDHCRNKLISDALKIEDLTHVWFLDADQYYDGAMLTKLLEADKDIIQPLTFMRGGGIKHHGPIAQSMETEGYHPVDIYTSIGELELKDYPVQCGLVGFGGTLIKADILRSMDYPWALYDRSYVDIWDGISEDVYFCRKARAQGRELWVHCGTKSLHETNTQVDETIWTDYQTKRSQGMVKNIPHAEASEDYMNYGANFFNAPHQVSWSESTELWDNITNIFMDQCRRHFPDGWLGMPILDFGSGTGVFRQAIDLQLNRGLNKSARITNLDSIINYDPSEYAQETFGAKPWKDVSGKYPIVFCSEVLEHCRNDGEAYAAVAKIVSTSPELVVASINVKEGQEMFVTHTCMHNREWWLNLFGKFPDLRYDKEHSDIAMGKDRFRMQWFIFKRAVK